MIRTYSVTVSIQLIDQGFLEQITDRMGRNCLNTDFHRVKLARVLINSIKYGIFQIVFQSNKSLASDQKLYLKLHLPLNAVNNKIIIKAVE